MALLHTQQDETARALPLAQEAADAYARIGHAEYTQRARQLVDQLQGSSTPAPTQAEPENPAQAAFKAFQRADNPQAMKTALAQYPLMAEPDFVQAIEEVIKQQVPSEGRPQFEQRLAWLKQISES